MEKGGADFEGHEIYEIGTRPQGRTQVCLLVRNKRFLESFPMFTIWSEINFMKNLR